MSCMLSVNLLFLLLQCIKQLFFIFLDIFEALNFRVFSFLHLLPWSCVLTLMLIGLETPLIVNLPHVFAFSQETHLSLGRVRDKTLSFVLLQKLNIMSLLLPLQSQFGCVGYSLTCVFLSLDPLPCIVTTRVSSKLLITRSFMSTQSILNFTSSSSTWHHYFSFCFFSYADC